MAVIFIMLVAITFLILSSKENSPMKVLILHECPTCQSMVDIRKLHWVLKNKLLSLTAQSITLQESLDRAGKKNPTGKLALESQLQSMKEEIKLLVSLVEAASEPQ